MTEPSQATVGRMIASLPLALAISLLSTVIGGVYFASAVVAHVEDHERRIAAIEATQDARFTTLSDKLTAIQVQLGGLTESLKAGREVIDRLQAMQDRRMPPTR